MLFGFLLSLDCLHGRSALGMRVSCVIFSTQAILAWSVCGFSNMGKKKWTRPRASKRSGPSQTLKRGCLRLKATASHSGGGSAKKHADYVPECQQEASQPRRGREELSISGSALRALPLRKLVKHLQDFGHLPCAGTKSPCLHCGLRTLSTKGAQDVPSVLQGTGQKCYRCTKKSCNKQQHVLSKSPVFYVGRGTDSPSLTTQACVLWHLAWRTPSRLVRAELHLNEKRIDAMRHRWRAVVCSESKSLGTLWPGRAGWGPKSGVSALRWSWKSGLATTAFRQPRPQVVLRRHRFPLVSGRTYVGLESSFMFSYAPFIQGLSLRATGLRFRV